MAKFSPEIQNCLFKSNFGTYTNLNIQHPVVMFTFPLLDRQIWINLVQNIKVAFLIGKLVLKDEIEYTEFVADDLFFCFRPNMLCLGKFCPKK